MKFNLFGIFSHKSKDSAAAPEVTPISAPTDVSATQTANFVDTSVSVPMNSAQPNTTSTDPFNTPIEPSSETSFSSIADSQPITPPSEVIADVVSPSAVPPENNSPSQPTPPSTPSQF